MNGTSCPKCGSPIPERTFQRKTKAGKIVTVHTHTSLCEHCPPPEIFNLTDWANRLCSRYPERIVVLSECSCDAKKINHHPSYKKPFEIMKICRVCHKAEHRRLRELANSPIPQTPTQSKPVPSGRTQSMTLSPGSSLVEASPAGELANPNAGSREQVAADRRGSQQSLF